MRCKLSARRSSGAIASFDPDGLTINTPLATIGIRGTDFFAGPLAAGMPPGEVHYGVMLIEGAIDVATPEGSVVLDQPLEGTFIPIDGGAAPTEPNTWSDEAQAEAFAAIAFP